MKVYNFYGFVCDGVYKDLEDLQTSPKPAKYPANGVFDRTNTCLLYTSRCV